MYMFCAGKELCIQIVMVGQITPTPIWSEKNIQIYPLGRCTTWSFLIYFNVLFAELWKPDFGSTCHTLISLYTQVKFWSEIILPAKQRKHTIKKIYQGLRVKLETPLLDARSTQHNIYQGLRVNKVHDRSWEIGKFQKKIKHMVGITSFQPTPLQIDS
jgi:hypothetical protein